MGSHRSSSSRSKRSTDHPTLFPTMNPTQNPTVDPTQSPTLAPSVSLAPSKSPTGSPTFCGKAAKSWYYDDDWTYTSGKTRKSGPTRDLSDCHKGARPSSKGGKSGDDTRRLYTSDASVNKIRSVDRTPSAPVALKVRRRRINGGD